MEEKKPKKRGRKPKKDTELNGKKKYTINDNLIIKLTHVYGEEDIIEPYSIDIESIDKYEKSNKTAEVCWNCCHKFDSIIYGIPLKYINGVFYTYGDFCSLECCSRYSIEKFQNYFEVFSLINLYNNVIKGKKDKNISIAPNRLLLNIFGGPLTIEEYRKGFSNKDIHDIKIPPILPIRHNIDLYETSQVNNKSNIKLYRKKPLPSEEKSITNSMKLSIT